MSAKSAPERPTPRSVNDNDIFKEILSEAEKYNDSSRGKKKIPLDFDKFRHFLELFFEGDALQELRRTDSDVAFRIALRLWRKTQVRQTEDINIEVYNPTKEGHGYNSRFTVIEINQKDIPFLVDSLVVYLQRKKHMMKRLFHPYIKVRRNDKGELLSVHAPESDAPDLLQESLIHIEIEQISDKEELKALESDIRKVMNDVWTTVHDWQAMLGRIADTISKLETYKDDEDYVEAVEFLNFLKNNNFTFLGYREYSLDHTTGKPKLSLIANTSLGVLRNEDLLLFGGLRNHTEGLPEDVSRRILDDTPFLVVKADQRSRVHRPAYMDVIMVKSRNKKGEVVKVRLFTGLFTAECYTRSTDQIPYLRRKAEKVLNEVGFSPISHSGKALRNVIDTYPRDELFQIEHEDLKRISQGIKRLKYHPQADLFIRKDAFHRYFSCLAFIPRDRFNTQTRNAVGKVLEEKLHGKNLIYYVDVNESALARVHYLIGTSGHSLPEHNIELIKQAIKETIEEWSDQLKRHTMGLLGEDKARSILRLFNGAFPASYREEIRPEQAARDLQLFYKTLKEQDITVQFEQPDNDDPQSLIFKVYRRKESMPLSQIMPILQNAGFNVNNEHPYEITPQEDEPPVWLHLFSGKADIGSSIQEFNKVKERFEEAFIRIWYGEVDNDEFNRLIVSAGFNWRQTIIVRAYAHYLIQANYPFSLNYIAGTLSRNPEISRNLIELFRHLFDPQLQDNEDHEDKIEEIRNCLNEQLKNVEKIDEDRVLRSLATLIEKTLRTNFYQTNSEDRHHDYISFKLNSNEIEDLPMPRPKKEIYIYSRRFEAVHLRGGDVARGGIRWSDRFEDFRTEILGLVKAQMVKNAVIVPTGSKGGFICKRQPELMSRDEQQAEGIACYKMFMRAMLNITDNIVGDKIVPPKQVVRRDSDDPYLVVAADKGTATFSDLANTISQEKDFWLQDAFASGGSAGYDHKAMGITARGAWECVKRHFRELGKDIQEEPFTVVGCGDMSGDVFGNGMLLSKQIKLLAAFDHRNIFIDPDPDPQTSWKERCRLFGKLSSSWEDYDESKLSRGGRILSRKSKQVTVTKTIQKMFNLESDTLSPNELIRKILQMDAELLWFGGIGTYIKGSNQTHAEVGDKANDALRIDGSEVRAKVIGEGANLGVTQEGRIEFAHRGGKINTDFIDNSAGVDTSDHEVNLKIMFTKPVEENRLSVEERNNLLNEMEDEVGEHVLKNNYDQSLALSLAEHNGKHDLALQSELIKDLEEAKYMDRQIEKLPRDDIFHEMQMHGERLSRPELSVLLSYSKMMLYDTLIESDLPDTDEMQPHLLEYFPDLIMKKYQSDVEQHRLEREIIATEVANAVVNKMGPVFVKMMTSRCGADAADVARAFLITREVFNLKETWRKIDDLDNKVPADEQIELYMIGVKLITRATKWFLTNQKLPLDYCTLLEIYRDGIKTIRKEMDKLAPKALSDRIQGRQERMISELDLPSELAKDLAHLPALVMACDIINVAQKTDQDIKDVAQIYYAAAERFQFRVLFDLAEHMVIDDQWGQDARDGIIDDLYRSLSTISTCIVKKFMMKGKEEPVQSWENKNRKVVESIDKVLNDVTQRDQINFEMLILLSQRLRTLTL